MDERAFERSWTRLGARDTRAFAEVLARWSEPHRHYHTPEHLEECLAWLGMVAPENHEVAVALYFHDLVYEPTRRDNEAASAERFRELARDAGLRNEAIERVGQLIMSTARHDAVEGDAALLADIDLAILGSPPARYARFERDVRREYARFDDATYRNGRARVLRGFLERLAIFKTPCFQRLEPQARDNLARELTGHEREADEG